MKLNLTILKNIASVPPVGALINYAVNNSGEAYANLAAAVFESGWQKDFSACLYDAVLKDVNPFSVAAAKDESDVYLENSFDADASALFAAAHSLKDAVFNVGDKQPPKAGELKTFYGTHGYGDFIDNRAFFYKNGNLTPVLFSPKTELKDLKDYEDEKKAIAGNIENFLSGVPFSNMLLYGDRGTGKSSTVHAMLNNYYPSGLRIVELGKEEINSLSELKRKLGAVPLKFIIYIDDLSLTETDGKFTALKAALEGSFIGRTENTLICATSNRRHIVKENFSDRADSVHANDAVQEQLSLSDRFGLTVLFSSVNKQQYLSIFDQLAKDYGLNTDKEILESLAERWAILKGGRSPRRARQFAEFAYSCERRGLPIKF